MMRSNLLFAGVLTVCAASLSLGQGLPSLVTDAASPRANRAANSSRNGMEVRRSRFVEVNLDAIAGADATRRIHLSLFPDAQFDVEELKSYRSNDGSTHLWHGRIVGMRRGHVVLAATGDIVSANITTDSSAFYQIRQVDGMLHVVEQVDAVAGLSREDTLAAPAEQLVKEMQSERRAESEPRNAAGDTVIDVLVAYTVKARNAAGGTTAIQNRIQLAVAEVNQSFVNSGVQAELNLVNSLEVNYDEASGNGTALVRLREPADGFMDEVHTVRDTTGADLVSLWIDNLGSAPAGAIGVAYQMTTVSAAFRTNAFSVVEQSWATGPGYSFGHEMGHNMGAAHDRANVGDTGGFGAFSYSYGYRNTGSSPFRTIMALACENVTCPVINNWSNPDVSNNGNPTGIAANQANAADNRLTLNNTKATVANFRGTAGCTYQLSPTNPSHPSSETTSSISVIAGSNCPWTATTGDTWITITSGASGSGNGTVSYTVGANQAAAQRVGRITVGGQDVTVTQAGSNVGTIGITITTSPAGLSITVDGQLFTAPQLFQWQVGSTHTIAAASLQGSGGTRQMFLNWSDNGAASHVVVAPGVPTTYTANYQTQHALTLLPTPAGGGTVTSAPLSADGFYNAGTAVQVSASNSAGYEFVGWSGALSGSINPSIVTMDGPKTVTATFSNTATNVSITITTNPPGLLVQVDGAQYTTPQTITWTSGTTHTLIAPAVQNGPNSRSVFANWSNGGTQAQTLIAPSTATTYTATYTTQFQLTTTVVGGGTIAVNPASGDGFYAQGTTVQLTAAPAIGGQFQNWTGAVVSTTNPLAIVMDSPKALTANFTPGGNVIVNSVPAGLTVTVDGVAYTTPQSFTFTAGSSHVLSAPAQLGGTPTRQVFANWSNGGAATQTIVAAADQTFYTVTYVTQHLLTTNVIGSGTVSTNPSSADGFYPAGTQVFLTANPAAGSAFTGWTGAVSGSSNPILVVVDAPKSVTANINTPPSNITVTSNPAGLNVQVDGTTFVTPQTFQWTVGSTHVITALSPQSVIAGTRNTFAGWSDGGAISHTVTGPAAATTYTATYTTQHQLSTVVAPTGAGTILATPSSPDGFYDAGANIQLTANPAVSFQFTSWGGSLSGATNPQNLQMTAARSVTATFSPLASCAYAIDNTQAFIAGSGDLRTVLVSTGPTCTWTAVSNAPWITISSGATGTGNGTVKLAIAANDTNAQRTGTVTIAGFTYTVTEPSNACVFTLTVPQGLVLPSAAATYGITVATDTACQWTATSRGDWIGFNGASTGTGSGTVTFNALVNASAVPRTATITIGGVTVHFVQKSSTISQQYADVATTHPFFDYIALLRNSGVPDTCGPNAYCPETSIIRSSMAVFIVRTLFGDNFTFTQTPFFNDVPASHPQFSYIQKLRDIGVTNGCTASSYCPDDVVTRGQMAAFVVRAKLGIRFDQTFPFSSSQGFTDTPTSSIFFGYIQKLRELGVTLGCTTTTFCGDDVNSRGQMAAFLARGFF